MSQLLIMIEKVRKLVREYISVWDKVKRSFTKLVLHFTDVDSEFVFAGQFKALWKVIYLLVLIESFI